MTIRIRFAKGPALWVGVAFYFSLVAVPSTAHAIYGSWVLSIGLTMVWTCLYLVIGSMSMSRLLMPIHLWKLLGCRFPSTQKVTEQNADCLGFGTLNGCDLYFALVADKTALTVGIRKALFVRPKTIKIPWDQIEISRAGTNYDGAYVAVISFPSIDGCEMVLPWRRRFAKILDQVELGGSPAAS